MKNQQPATRAELEAFCDRAGLLPGSQARARVMKLALEAEAPADTAAASDMGTRVADALDRELFGAIRPVRPETAANQKEYRNGK